MPVLIVPDINALDAIYTPSTTGVVDAAVVPTVGSTAMLPFTIKDTNPELLGVMFIFPPMVRFPFTRNTMFSPLPTVQSPDVVISPVI